MTRIFRNPDVLWREEDDARDEVLTGIENGEEVAEIGTSLLFSGGQMIVLNILGTEIWKRCDGKTSEELITELLTEFEVDEETLRSDVMAFLAELEGKGLVNYA